MTSVDFFMKGHIIHGLLQGLDPLDAGAGFKSVCTSSCFKFKLRLCTKRNCLLTIIILYIYYIPCLKFPQLNETFL